MDADDPRHGHYSGWSQHRRDGDPMLGCVPCREARLRFQRRRGKLHKLGRPPRVQMGAVAHGKLDALREAGCSYLEMQAATGLSATTCRTILEGGPRYVGQRKHRDTLWAFDAEAFLEGRLTHIGMIRRVRALGRIGYSASTIADELGMARDAVKRIARGSRHSHFLTRRRIARLYDLWCMAPLDGTHDRFVSRTINRATRLGYAPPLAWDNIDRDAAPQGVERQCVEVDRLELLLELQELGLGRREAAARFGIGDEALQRWCERHDHLDVWEAMAS